MAQVEAELSALEMTDEELARVFGGYVEPVDSECPPEIASVDYSTSESVVL
ncbi:MULTISPECIES: hypothetical protein [Micromonospora]|uniref:hypothetical protein n=1 Tax=Micromonospora TaxID=1873 RepID=UPI001314C45E|nr:hypothetical protein [Micromonospora craterilacus]